MSGVLTLGENGLERNNNKTAGRPARSVRPSLKVKDRTAQKPKLAELERCDELVRPRFGGLEKGKGKMTGQGNVVRVELRLLHLLHLLPVITCTRSRGVSGRERLVVAQ